MNLTAAALLTLGFLAFVGGAYLLHPAVALLVGGSGCVALGVLTLEVDKKSEESGR